MRPDQRYSQLHLSRIDAFSSAARGLCMRPFLGQRFEDFGRFVANGCFAIGHGANQTAEDGHSAQLEVGAAVVDANLGVQFRQALLLRVFLDANFAVGASGYNAERGGHLGSRLRNVGREVQDAMSIDSQTVG